MKNPFKKSSIVDTLINVGVGGAANVAMDYAFSMLPADTFATVENPDNIKNVIKIAVGALGGSMSKNKYVRAAVDGIATVGAANLISGYITPADGGDQKQIPGVPFIGRLRAGQRGYRRAIRGTGKVGAINGEPFMSK